MSHLTLVKTCSWPGPVAFEPVHYLDKLVTPLIVTRRWVLCWSKPARL